MEFFLLLLSIPFFYVWGLISFIKFISRGSTSTKSATDRNSLVHLVLNELKKSSPEKKVGILIEEYEKELKAVEPDQTKLHTLEQDTTTVTTIAKTSVPIETKKTSITSPSFQNWYKDNSINLLLYIGAFLIIVSATIYVGLETVTGTSKGYVLSIITLLFFLSGLWFYKMPKVKAAGSAFTAIGALLIPISGLGWYNFVFKFTEVPMGIVWLVTSLVGLFAYIVLARYFKSVFYSYVSGFSTLSFSFALVNMQGLQNDFYILASIMSSILLLGVSIYFHYNKAESTEIFSQPFSLTANVVMPVSLLYGMVLISDGALFTLQSTLSILLGCVFYVISYHFFKKSWYLLAVLSLSSLTLLYFANWQHFSELNTLYLMTASAYFDIYVMYYFQKNQKADETNFASTLSVAKTIVIYAYAAGSGFAIEQLLFFAIIPIIVGILLALLRNNPFFVSLSSIFFALALYLGVYELLDLSTKPYILGMLYIISGIGWFFACIRYKHSQSALILSGYSCVLYFILGTLVIADNWGYQLANLLTLTLVCFSAYRIFARKEFLYLGSIVLSSSFWCLTHFIGLNTKPYILGTLYAIAGICWYYACAIYKHRLELKESFAFASCANFILSFLILFTSDYIGYQLLLTVILSGIMLSAAIDFRRQDFIYISNAFIILSVWNILRFLSVDLSVYPLSFMAAAYSLYFVGITLPQGYKDLYRNSGIITAIGISGFFSLYSFDSTSNAYNYKYNLELYALMSAYATFFLYGFDAYSKNSSKIGYITSIIGMLTYLWQIDYIGIIDTQYYTLPIGFYFIGLSYLQRKESDHNLKQIFDMLGIAFLIIPSWLLALGENGLTHALLLGLCGIILLAFGITFTDKWYKYAGIVSIVLAVMSQSKWTIIGIAGIGFLGLALYLLIFRKEDTDATRK